MQLAMVKVNAQMQEWGLPPLEMGIGINTGEVVVGNIGSEKRTKYGIVGSQVNLTYRIESCTTGGEILISESTLKEVGSIVETDSPRPVSAKGVKEPINIYKVTGMAGQYDLFLPQHQEELCTLSEPIPIEYALVDGKVIGCSSSKGTLVRLSTNEAEIFLTEELQEPPPYLSNIKLNLSNATQPEEKEDMYAKVLEKTPEVGHFCIRFTSRDPKIINLFNTLIEPVKTQNSQ